MNFVAQLWKYSFPTALDNPLSPSVTWVIFRDLRVFKPIQNSPMAIFTFGADGGASRKPSL